MGSRGQSSADTAMTLARMAQPGLNKCIRSHDISQLDEIVDMLELAAEIARSESCVGLPHILLTDALACRYEHKRERFDIDRCITIAQQTLLGFDNFRFRSKLIALYDLRYREFHDKADLDRSIDMAGDSIRRHELQEPPTQLLQCYFHHGNRLRQKFMILRDPEDLDHSVRTFERALQDRTLGDPSSMQHHQMPVLTSKLMASLSLSLAHQFTHTRNISTIDRAIVVAEEANRLLVASKSNNSAMISILAACLALRAWETRQTNNINAAISLIESMRKDQMHIVLTKYLGYLFAAKYSISGSIRDYDRSIKEFLSSCDFRPLDMLEQGLVERYIKHGAKSDLDRYDSLLKGKLAAFTQRDLSPAGPAGPAGPTAPIQSADISGVLSCTSVDDHLSSLNRAIQVANHALAVMPFDHPSRTRFKPKLARWLTARARYTGCTSDIDQAALVLSPFNPDRTSYNTNEVVAYAAIIDARFKMNGDTSDIDMTTYALQEIARKSKPSISAVTVSLTEEPSRSVFWVPGPENTSEESSKISIEILASLANMQNCRYLAFGHIADLNSAIENMELAAVKQHVSLDTGVRSALHSMYFNLAVLTMTRYNRYLSQKDFRNAMHWCNKGLELAEEGDPSRSDMLGLRSSLFSVRFSRSADKSDLDMAISDARHAYEASRNPQQRASHLVSLGLYMRRRYARDKDLRDLDESIRSTKKALSMLEEPWLGASRHVGLLGLRQLSRSLLQKVNAYGAVHRMHDLDEAVDAIEKAEKNLRGEDPLGVNVYWDLGRAYQERLKYRAQCRPNQDHDEVREDSVLAIIAFDKCVKSARVQAPSQIHAALESVPLLRSLGRGWECVDLLKHAFSKISPLAPRFLPRGDQESNLARETPGRTAEAAAILVEEGAHPQEALALLDSGRGILANRALQARADISMLDASTANKFESLLEALSFNEEANIFQRDSYLRDRDRLLEQMGKDAHEQGAQLPFAAFPQRESYWDLKGDLYERFRAEEDLEALVRQIRSQPTTKNFLGPPTIEQVLKVLGEDTLVVINDCKPYHTFIIDRRFWLRVIKLSNLDAEAVKKWTTDLKRNRPFIDPAMLQWLWITISDPIIQEINLERGPTTEGHGRTLPRIVWMPIGNLSHLPLHAAGFHGQPSKTVMDCAVSSYASSLTAFVLGRSEPEPSFQASITRKALLIGMDTTDCVEPENTAGFIPLPFAKDEVNQVDQFCPSLHLEVLSMAEAYRGEVLMDLRECTLFHFAGHGVSRPEDPSSSGLAMKDKLLTISLLQSDTSMSVVRPRRSDSSSGRQKQFLAYLSACLTGSLDTPKLLDEGINIVSGFQLAGFRHVIGTTWQVSDKHCVKVAEIFYRNLAIMGLKDSAVSLALHYALVAERDAWIEAESEQDVAFVRHAPGEEIADDDEKSGGQTSAATQRDMDLVRKKHEAPSRKLVRAWWVPYVHFGP